jgi:hypothetical protein
MTKEPRIRQILENPPYHVDQSRKKPSTRRCNRFPTVGTVTASNSGEPLAFSGIFAANDAFQVQVSAQDGHHVMFLPFGEHPVAVKDPKSGRSVPAVQVFNQDSAQELMESMSSTTGKAALRLGAIPVKVGHPDVPELAHLFHDSKSYGRIVAANIGERETAKGLELTVKFSPAGLRLIEEDAYRFYSPFWTLRKINVANGVLYAQPCALISVGLTDTPNMPVPAISAANVDDLMGEPAALVTPEPPPPPKPSLLDRLMDLLGLSDEDGIIAKISEMKAAAASILDAHAVEQRASEEKYKALEQTMVALQSANAALTEQLAAANDSLAQINGELAAANDQVATRSALLNDSENELGSEKAARQRAETDLADVRAQLVASNALRQQADALVLAANTAVAQQPVLEDRLVRISEVLVDQAISAGLVRGGEKNDLLTAFNTDFDQTLRRISNAEPVVPLGSHTVNLARRRAGGSALDEYVSAVNSYMQSSGCVDYEKAWAYVGRIRQDLVAAIKCE